MINCEAFVCENTFADRKFLTREEKARVLEEYKEWLDSVSKGVAEAIAKLKRAE